MNLEKGETVIMHNSNVMVHFSATSNDNDEWTGEDIRSRPKVVRRGIDDFESEIDDGRGLLHWRFPTNFSCTWAGTS